MSTFLVTLITGHQGSSTAHQLLAAGHKVRGIVRDLKSPAAVDLTSIGVELYQATFEDVSTIQIAARGATGIFLNPIASFTDTSFQLRSTQNVLNAARAAQSVTTIVLSTAATVGKHYEWAAENPGYPTVVLNKQKAECEEAVLSSGFPYITILRPGWLMHNYTVPRYLDIHFPGVRQTHVLNVAFKPETRLPHLDAADVGKFAAAAFTKPERFAGKKIELGAENLTIEQAASELSRATGIEFKVRYMDQAEAEDMVSKSPSIRFQLVANWKNSDILAGSLDEYDIRLTTFAEYLAREKDGLEDTFKV